MMVARFLKHPALLLAALLASVIGACRKDIPPEPSAETRARVAATLAKADALDGATDKVVAKCAMCALRMEGSPEHESKHAAYTMHFCSAGCKDGFAEDPVNAILAMDVPEE